MILWTLAWRNVLRNRRRSLITIASIAVGLAALTFLWGFVDGMNRQMVENTTRYFAGDVQVHVAGYHEDPSLDRAIADAAPLIDALRGEPAVAAASLRLEGKALASHGAMSRGVKVVGIDPRSEAPVTDLLKAIVDGAPLDAGATGGVLIGTQLAESLGVKAGDEIVLVGQAYDGSVASGRLPVRGVFRTQIDELDGYLAVAPLATVREFLAAPGAATAVALRLRDRNALAAVQASLAERLGPRYEVVGWPTLLPMVAVSTRYHEVMSYVVLAVFFVVVGAGVANPVLMAVLERTREFGVMLALGTSRSRLLRLVLYEALLLGAIGLVIGNAIGLALTAAFGRLGIDLSAFGAAQRTMPGLADIVYPVVQPERSVMISALLFGIAALVALLPALKAAGLDPVAAIRGIGGMVGARGSASHAGGGRGPVFVRIALRNLLRNRRRSAITVGGTAFAIVAYVFLFGYFDGFSAQIVDNATRYVTGHVQLERSGFRRDLAPELALDDAPALLATLRGMPNVAAAAPRVQAQALASSATKSEGILLFGVDPVAERELTVIHRAIVQGNALDASAPQPAQDRDIVIGRKLAEKLGARLGEKLVVMAPAADGELGTAAYRIRGIFATESSSFDGAMAFVTLPAAQALLGMGSRVSTINLRLADRDALPATLATLRGRVTATGLAFAPWQKLMPQVDQMVGLIGTIRSIIVGIFFVVVALAVLNTVYMAVSERTREFGVMMALGTPPAAIVRMVLYETAALMVLASLLGYGLGAALVAELGRRGMDLSVFFADYSSIPGLTGIAYPRLVVASLVLPGLALFIASVGIALFPAARAARLDPVRAIRHV
ncbi:MAG: ABC transporter permease [Burkholderiaceae bacterium]|nr:ABC transporter permease [Burkholderiaceae bacterium]